MAKKLKPLEQLTWIAITTPTAAGAFWFAAQTIDTLAGLPDELIAAAPSAGATVALGYWTLNQFSRLSGKTRQSTSYSNIFARSEKIIAIAPKQNYVWQFDEAPEFEFRGLGLPMPIPESILYRFLRLARRRQNNALMDSKFTMFNELNIKRLTANQILTERYYIEDVRPRFQKIEYDSCLLILGFTRLITGRGPGRSGTLRDDAGMDASKMLEVAKMRWTRLVDPPTVQSRIVSLPQPFYQLVEVGKGLLRLPEVIGS